MAANEPGGHYRPDQRAMAEALIKAMRDNQRILRSEDIPKDAPKGKSK